MAASSFFVPLTSSGLGTDVVGTQLSLVTEKTGVFLVFPASTLDAPMTPITGQIWPRSFPRLSERE